MCSAAGWASHHDPPDARRLMIHRTATAGGVLSSHAPPNNSFFFSVKLLVPSLVFFFGETSVRLPSLFVSSARSSGEKSRTHSEFAPGFCGRTCSTWLFLVVAYLRGEGE